MSCLAFIGGVDSERPAIRDDARGKWLTYGALTRLAVNWAERLESRRGLVFLFASNDIDTVAALIGAVAAGHAVVLLDPKMSESSRADLVSMYEPRWIVDPMGSRVVARRDGPTVHPDLSILLSTSGSTGSAKLVRLSLDAVEANARGIANVLDIHPDDVAAGYLPVHYSYGLSVLTSHLVQGARVRLTSESFTDRGFWRAMRESRVTHFPGVPFHYRIMSKLGFGRLDMCALRTMTQAGGALEPALRREAHCFMQERGGRFFVMYGQTEAAPRMTTLRHEDFPLAPLSVGTALPGCRIEIESPDASGRGEVVFYGPNVMMGYAETRHDLARGDEMRGRLATGDIGVLDDADRLTIVGRQKRIGKLNGLRISLDEVESVANECGTTAVTQKGEHLIIHVCGTGDSGVDEALSTKILRTLQERFTIPLVSYRIQVVPSIPRTERGKIDYTAIESLS